MIAQHFTRASQAGMRIDIIAAGFVRCGRAAGISESIDGHFDRGSIPEHSRIFTSAKRRSGSVRRLG